MYACTVRLERYIPTGIVIHVGVCLCMYVDVCSIYIYTHIHMDPSRILEAAGGLELELWLRLEACGGAWVSGFSPSQPGPPEHLARTWIP